MEARGGRLLARHCDAFPAPSARADGVLWTELAGMLVSGGGGGGAGMTGALMTAATGGKAMLAGKAAGAVGGK